MANNYNVIAPSGAEYPTQEFVDCFLNSIDNCFSCADIEKLKDLGEEKAKEYISNSIDKITKQVNGYFESIINSFTSKMQPIEALISPPSGLDGVISYCTSLAEYFSKPYTQMVQLMAFYTAFAAAATTALNKKLNDMACLATITNTGEK